MMVTIFLLIESLLERISKLFVQLICDAGDDTILLSLKVL